MKSYKTNEQLLRALFKDLTTIEAALLRERLQKISELTRDAIKNDPKSFANPFVSERDFLRLCDKIDNHLSIQV